jgi:SAM-dependent methyltransferase
VGRVPARKAEANVTNVKAQFAKRVKMGGYQQLIDPKDRHELGEYYTPDWLCERIVDELLPKQGFKAMLDPGCGSGSFLRAAIHHFLAHNTEGTENDRLRLILGHVQGIDIHPVAVTIARATYVLALGKLINFARKPINIPVYLADSLFLPREVEQNLYEKLSGFEITFGEKKNEKSVAMPDWLIHSPELFDDAITACTTVAEEHAKTKTDTRKTLDKYLTVHVPEIYKLLEHDKIIDALWLFTDALSDLIRQQKNTIWSFIIRNSYRPAMLKGQFDFIIGNPPWLSYRFISDPDYQKEVKTRAVEWYGVAPKKQKLMTQMELATVFLAHSMATFAKPTAVLGFVMPRAVLNADQHQNLIKREYKPAARFKLTGYWDLWDVVPLFNVPACVLFAKRETLPGSPKEKLPVLEWEGKLPGRDVSWAVAKKCLNSSDKIGRVIYLGSRAALSTAPGATSPSAPSKYLKVFKQGATIVPRSFYFVKIDDLGTTLDPDNLYWAKTEPEQAAQAKKPYNDVKMSGLVEGRFIYTTAVSRHLVPYAMLPPVTVVLPIEIKDDVPMMVTADTLTKNGYREFGKWMHEAERLWAEKRGEKADKETAYEWLDYQGKLTAQDMRHKHLVLYNHSGMNVAAAYFNRQNQFAPFIVDVKLYWAAFSTRAEADYVVAVFNSETVNLAIKPFQSVGLLGERDIHKKLLELPIPVYDHEDPKHQKISELGAKARETAVIAIKSGTFPLDSSIAKQRGFIRTHLEVEMEEIDTLVAKLLCKE